MHPMRYTKLYRGRKGEQRTTAELKTLYSSRAVCWIFLDFFFVADIRVFDFVERLRIHATSLATCTLRDSFNPSNSNWKPGDGVPGPEITGLMTRSKYVLSHTGQI